MEKEKMVSYVKYEHELEPEYREKLAEAKRKSDVREVFAEFVIRLLRMINPDIPFSFKEQIRFDEKEFQFEFVDELKQAVDELSAGSDLKAIINRMYEAANKRYKKIEHDENLDYFRLGNNAKKE
ncbi:hypothetical protein SAMN04488510_10325 [Fervidobacterium changbaicum]|uniref:Uncharacterized protein n=2 Tax=Fervidobacterium TaxID=2422 RepID=A0AAI8GDF7_FERIS|nr:MULTISPECIES: hypothetical protein [Fervidobacterium]AMW32969.1 hypothetical protein NA23_06695 [Fervidobacterium islandicum]QAV33010.1 hypothetical protein CBS1_04195 [Fervidobacterium changbaicum]SDH01073.1 hypothetical protein SAMN04488510_10325 [Fervidobacterium changbaicum]